MLHDLFVCDSLLIFVFYWDATIVTPSKVFFFFFVKDVVGGMLIFLLPCG